MNYDTPGAEARRCPKCGLKFTSKEKLELHQKIHESPPNPQRRTIWDGHTFSNCRCKPEEHERMGRLHGAYLKTPSAYDTRDGRGRRTEFSAASRIFGDYEGASSPSALHSSHQTSTKRPSVFEAGGSFSESRWGRLGRYATTLRNTRWPRTELHTETEDELLSELSPPDEPPAAGPPLTRLSSTSELSERVFEDDLVPSSYRPVPWISDTNHRRFWSLEETTFHMSRASRLTSFRQSNNPVYDADLNTIGPFSNSEQQALDTTSELSLELSRSPSPMSLPDTPRRQEKTLTHNPAILTPLTPSSISEQQLSDVASELSLEVSRSPSPISLADG